MNDRDGQASRRIYGRGFYDGQRKVLESMNNARMIQMEQSLTGIARKVLEATPIAEPWAISKICSEMHRLGHTPDRKMVTGCLASLTQKGFVREPEQGNFIRVSPKPKLVSARIEQLDEETTDMPIKPITAVPPPAPAAAPSQAPASQPDPMKRIIEVVAKVRALATCATDIAAEIEDLALEIEGRIERNSLETQKLRQLQELLKSIGQ